jgi:hypothetical protein
MLNTIERAFRIAFFRALRRNGESGREWAFSNAAYALSGYLGFAFASLITLGMVAFYWFARDGVPPTDGEGKVIALAGGLVFVLLSMALQQRFRRRLADKMDSRAEETLEDARFWLRFRVMSVGSLIAALALATFVFWSPI